MAIQYVGGASVGSTAATYDLSLTALSGGIGTSPAAGDLILVNSTLVATSDVVLGPTTAGYTEVTELFANDTRDSNQDVSYKISDGTETLVTVVGSNNTNNGSTVYVTVWRGVDNTTPFDATFATATGIDSALADAPAITPVTAGALVIAAMCVTGDSAIAAFTGPTGMTFVEERNHTGVQRGTVASFAWVAWTSGAYDPTALTGGESTTADSWTAVTMALRPAAGTVTSFPPPLARGASSRFQHALVR